MLLLTIVALVLRLAESFSSSYKITSATAWITDPISLYVDFAASLTPTDSSPSVFQYWYRGAPAVFTCTTRNCTGVSFVPLPGLNAARLAHGGVPARRIRQQSPTVAGAQFFLSTGYATPNRDTELIVCQPDDSTCSKPQISNTVNSPGFGQAGLRLTFTRPSGLPIMVIPQARYASVDNRVTGYTIEACQDPLCQLPRTRAALPFNLTGKAYCEGTSVDVALNQRGLPSWLTLCGQELNLIHCLSATCNETLVNQFEVNRDRVYFVYTAVDSKFRFTITANGQTPKSDITYIRCLDPDCTESIQSQLTLINRSSVSRVQVAIDPRTDLPILHLTGSVYPSDTSVYTFVVCQDIACDMSRAVSIDYGGVRFGLSREHASDVFVDDQGTVSAVIRTVHTPTNMTVSAVVQLALTDQAEIETLTFVEPTSMF